MKTVKTKGDNSIKTKGKSNSLDNAVHLTSKTKETILRSKDAAQNLSDDGQITPEEYAEDNIRYAAEDIGKDTVHHAKKTARKAIQMKKAKEDVPESDVDDDVPKQSTESGKKLEAKETAPAKDGNAERKEQKQSGSIRRKSEEQKRLAKNGQSTEKAKSQNRNVRTVDRSSVKTIKRDIKTREQVLQRTEQSAKASYEATQKAVKTADRTAKATAKTAQKTAQASKKAAEVAAKTAKKSAELAREAAIKAYQGAVAVAKATAAAVKAIAAGISKLIAAIAAGGSVAAIVILVICVIGLIVGSCFGIFFSGEDTGNGMSMRTAMTNINNEYNNKIIGIRNGTSYDVLEMSGSRAVWPDVLAVYAVKTASDPDNPQEIASMDDDKQKILSEIFWEMNEVSSRKESKTETVITETDDGNGNIVETASEVTHTYLYITVSHKSVDEMAAQYHFTDEQKELLAELRTPDKQKLWSQVLYGYNAGNEDIVVIALSQIGNVGGEPYWSWYGFGSRVEWCACFVSWCANEAGYIEIGVIPKFAGCCNGVDWFKERGQWQDKSYTPNPGDIIFFDWDSPNGSSGPQDGLADHVGIVEKVENGIVYTVEGNTSDSCRERQYSVGYYEILGYGLPSY